MNFGANFPFSFFGFGNPKREGSWKSFVLRDPETGEFEVWATNRWSHVCLSYRKRDGHIRVVKVRFFWSKLDVATQNKHYISINAKLNTPSGISISSVRKGV